MGRAGTGRESRASGGWVDSEHRVHFSLCSDHGKSLASSEVLVCSCPAKAGEGPEAKQRPLLGE